MRKDLLLLEELLLRTMLAEIEERYQKVMKAHGEEEEVTVLADSLLSIGRIVEEVFREIPNPQKKMGEELYTTLYEVLKDVSSALSELANADDDRLQSVLASAYRRLDGFNSLFEKLV